MMSIVRPRTAAIVSGLCLMLAGCLSFSGNSADSNEWLDCVLSNAKRMPTSAGTPSDIADAALAACKLQEDVFAQKIQVMYPGASPDISTWRDQMRQRAITSVVEIRSSH
jgi:hypothetical protein